MKREWLDKIPAYVLGFVVGGGFHVLDDFCKA